MLCRSLQVIQWNVFSLYLLFLFFWRMIVWSLQKECKSLRLSIQRNGRNWFKSLRMPVKIEQDNTKSVSVYSRFELVLSPIFLLLLYLVPSGVSMWIYLFLISGCELLQLVYVIYLKFSDKQAKIRWQVEVNDRPDEKKSFKIEHTYQPGWQHKWKLWNSSIFTYKHTQTQFPTTTIWWISSAQ